MKSRLLLLCFITLLANVALASTKPVTMRLTVADDTSHFLLNIKIEDGWKIYGPYWSREGKPISMNTEGSSNVSALYLSWPEPGYDAKLHDTDNSYYKEVSVPLSVDANPEDEIRLQLNVSVVACKDICMQISETLHAEVNVKPSDFYEKLFITMALALIGGFVLNFMPCVLPVIVLKAYSIAKYSGKSKKAVRIDGLCTALGVISTFICLALVVISMRSVGNGLGWGMHFQQPVFIILVAIVIFVSALVMRDDLSITIPGVNLIDDKSAHVTSFFSGVLTTILSTPCTAPFITSAIAFALTQKAPVIMLIYCSMGVGMALPFILIGMNPNVARVLPRPGAWTKYLKNFFGLLMFMTVIWLLYVLNNQLGMKSAAMICGGLILLKFALTRLPSWKKWFAAASVMIIMLAIPNEVAKKDMLKKQWADSYWEPLSIKRLNQYTAQGKLVLVDVTADWCVLCKVNKFLVLENIAVLEFLKMHDVKMLRGDLTSSSPEIDRYMQQEKRNGIPYDVIYGPKNMRKIILSEILTAKMLYEAVHELGK